MFSKKMSALRCNQTVSQQSQRRRPQQHSLCWQRLCSSSSTSTSISSSHHSFVSTKSSLSSSTHRRSFLVPVLVMLLMLECSFLTQANKKLNDELEYSDSTYGVQQQQPFAFTRISSRNELSSKPTPKGKLRSTVKQIMVSSNFSKRSEYNLRSNSNDTFQPLQPFYAALRLNSKPAVEQQQQNTSHSQVAHSKTSNKSATNTTISSTDEESISISSTTTTPVTLAQVFSDQFLSSPVRYKIIAPSSTLESTSGSSNHSFSGNEFTSNQTTDRWNDSLPFELHPLSTHRRSASTKKPTFGRPTEQHSVMINHGGGAISTIRRSLMSPQSPFVHQLQMGGFSSAGNPLNPHHFAPIQLDNLNFNDDFTVPPAHHVSNEKPQHNNSPVASGLNSPPKRVRFSINPEVASRRLGPSLKPMPGPHLNHDQSPPPHRQIHSAHKQHSSVSLPQANGNSGPSYPSSLSSLRPADLPNYAELSFFGYNFDQPQQLGPAREFNHKEQYNHDRPPIDQLERRPLFT